MPLPQTLQAYFDIAWQHAQVMPSLAIEPDLNMCAYRLPDGSNKCIIGAAIPDSRYTPDIEGLTASAALEECSMPIPDRSAIDYLQQCHDSLRNAHAPHEVPADWRESLLANLQNFAAKYKLTVPREPRTHYVGDKDLMIIDDGRED